MGSRADRQVPEVPVRELDAMLARMSWDEKVAQLQIAYRPRFEDAIALVRSGIGAVFWPGDLVRTRELQRIAREETPHGIPLLIGLDVIHGQYTIFPTPLAEACSFDPDVAMIDARESAQEAASGGVNWTFSPMVDISTDPRWGRVVEGFGEDPYLTSVFAAAKVRAYQSEDLSAPGTLLACAKHYIAYGAGEGGRDYDATDVSEYRLRNTYLPPFQASVDAGVASVMASFNTVAGRPMHANRRLLTDVLKHQLGFAGVVVGDADGVVQLVAHGVSHNNADAVALAISAGLDIEMGGNVIGADGHAVVSPQSVPEERVNDAVRRILRLKLARGLFSETASEHAVEVRHPTERTRELARGVAHRCAVLLSNDGTLPISPSISSVLLVGPYATSTDHLGAWTQNFAAQSRSIDECLREALPNTSVTTMTGGAFFREDLEARAAAVAAAASNDVVIVAVGEPSSLSGEASSRSEPALTGDQAALIRELVATGVPVAVILVAERPLIIADWVDLPGAVLQTGHLGTEAGSAIVDLVLGIANPGGRLAMSIPRSAGQIPIRYNHENTGRPPSVRGQLEHEDVDVALVGPGDTDDYFTSKYLDLDLGPKFEFGHGLSYTTFEVSAPVVSTPSLTMSTLASDGLSVSVTVTNSGARSGDEVVQLYIRDLVASIAQPVRRLRGFRRVSLEPGETTSVDFALSAIDLGYWSDGVEAELVLEPGTYELHVGGSVSSTRVALVELAL